jgi:penicillin-binding protein 1A
MSIRWLLIALAVAGCGDERAPKPSRHADDTDDDLPRDLTAFLDCAAPRAIDKIPSHVALAFVAAEDRRFFDGSKSSPIVRMVVLQIPFIAERCLGREVGRRMPDREAKVEARLEDELTRRQIYLNNVYLGRRAYGVVAAAKAFFGKELDLVTVGEAALFAGIAASPTKYSPVRNLSMARDRQTYVLGKMRDDGYISETQYKAAVSEPVSLVDEPAP